MKQVVIVEDDDDLRDLLQSLLQGFGLSVVAYPNAKEFLKDRIKGDMYLFDINLPEIDGIELCKLIKADHDRSVVILTSANPDIKQLSVEACADDYLSKPFSVRDVEQKIRLFLDNAAGPA